jgi:hypothetical protein
MFIAYSGYVSYRALPLICLHSVIADISDKKNLVPPYWSDVRRVWHIISYLSQGNLTTKLEFQILLNSPQAIHCHANI